MFRHTQQLGPEGKVRSIQTLDLNPPLPAAISQADGQAAGSFYFEFLHRLGGPLLRIARRPDGGVSVAAPLGLTLLDFGPPVLERLADDGLAIRFPIGTGAVVQREGERQGYLGMRLESHQIALEVEGYYARIPGRRGALLRRWLYLGSQNALHVFIAWLYLRRLAARLRA